MGLERGQPQLHDRPRLPSSHASHDRVQRILPHFPHIALGLDDSIDAALWIEVRKCIGEKCIGEKWVGEKWVGEADMGRVNDASIIDHFLHQDGLAKFIDWIRLPTFRQLVEEIFSLILRLSLRTLSLILRLSLRTHTSIHQVTEMQMSGGVPGSAWTGASRCAAVCRP